MSTSSVTTPSGNNPESMSCIITLIAWILPALAAILLIAFGPYPWTHALLIGLGIMYVVPKGISVLFATLGVALLGLMNRDLKASRRVGLVALSIAYLVLCVVFAFTFLWLFAWSGLTFWTALVVSVVLGLVGDVINFVIQMAVVTTADSPTAEHAKS